MTVKITQFPPELLLEIFRWSLQPPLDGPGRWHFMVLRSVCSTWRTLSFSTPELWSNLSVDTGDVFPYYSTPEKDSDGEPSLSATTSRGSYPFQTNLPSRIEAWFARASATTPLTLRITDHFAGDEWSRMEQLANIACQPRAWFDLDIQIPIDVPFTSKDQNVLWRVAGLADVDDDPRPWKDLRRLSIMCTRFMDAYFPLPQKLIPLDTCAPVLQELTLDVDSMNVSFPRPHENISILHLRLLNVSAGFIAKEIIGRLPNLSHLSVTGRTCARWRLWPIMQIPFDSRDIQPSGAVISATSPLDTTGSDAVERVEIDRDGIYILNYLCLPRLRRIRVRNSDSTKVATTILVDLIHRSKCDQTLEVIDLREQGVTDGVPREDMLEDLRQRLGETLAGRVEL
ncbi:hypothetical protein BKA70DRAFT_1426462 [Coprinopsis sp. MPI-PUGE-AT-0042]|nr:hypothetical protein BKA70DRAFT_1426462 [Coprinopsis sp. MPI-PUGE-AT-0042]